MDQNTIGQDSNVQPPVEFTSNTLISVPPLVPGEVIQERQMTKEEFEQNRKVAIKLTSYIGAEAESVDSRLGKPFEIIGAIQHPCTVTDDDGVEKPETRTVFKIKDGKNLSFVSKAATSFFNNCLKPFFGTGDFAYPVLIEVTQTGGGDKRTYNFQCIE